jgi:hypothetical protein
MSAIFRYGWLQAAEGVDFDNPHVAILAAHSRPRGRVSRGVGSKRTTKPPCGRDADPTGGPSLSGACIG